MKVKLEAMKLDLKKIIFRYFVEFRWENIISIYNAGENRGGYKWI
jgi:hypothetical protein